MNFDGCVDSQELRPPLPRTARGAEVLDERIRCIANVSPNRIQDREMAAAIA